MHARIPDCLPMVGRLTRVSKGKYVVRLKFKQSRRHYGDEIIHAADKRTALKLAKRMYPSATIK